jgi:predicted membrane channel-forming protein YqfA (hemolysin III family)
MMNNYPRRGPNFFLVILYLVFAFYFVNVPFQFVKIPESFSIANNWIIFIGGVLLLFGAINYFRASRMY